MFHPFSLEYVFDSPNLPLQEVIDEAASPLDLVICANPESGYGFV